MADDVPFEKTETGAYVRTHKATLVGATGDLDTEILLLDPNAKVSIMIQVGSGETVSIKASLEPHDTVTPGDLQDIVTDITEDYDNVFLGPITALAVVGPVSTNNVVVRVCEKNNPG